MQRNFRHRRQYHPYIDDIDVYASTIQSQAARSYRKQFVALRGYSITNA